MKTIFTYILLGNLLLLMVCLVGCNRGSTLSSEQVVEVEGLDIEKLRSYAEQDMPDAQRLLGECYIKGIGVEHNMPEAIKWMRRAGENGDVEALTFLAQYYDRGDGKDPVEAKIWGEKAGQALADLFIETYKTE